MIWIIPKQESMTILQNSFVISKGKSVSNVDFLNVDRSMYYGRKKSEDKLVIALEESKLKSRITYLQEFWIPKHAQSSFVIFFMFPLLLWFSILLWIFRVIEFPIPLRHSGSSVLATFWSIQHLEGWKNLREFGLCKNINDNRKSLSNNFQIFFRFMNEFGSLLID